MKYINFLSFGKDSLAQTILLKEQGYSLDETVFVDIKFDELTSGEYPAMAAWIPTAENILLKRNAATRLKCKGGLGKGFCGVIDCDYYNCDNADGCVKAHFTQ